MEKINLDGTEYEYDSLSDDSKAQVASLQFVRSELNRLQGQVAVHKTAEAAYIQAFKQSLEA
tara:strand:- start:23 stop:208 length:186 start_codon:yes stop_codon:yes gene_type:complete